MNIYKCKVFFEDTDAAQIVYHANYLRYCDRARTEWMGDLGVSFLNLLQQTQTTFVVADLSMRFLRPARLGERLQVRSTIVALGRAEVTFDQRVQLEDSLEENASLCHVKVRCAYVRGPVYRPTRIPRELHARLQQEVLPHD